MFKKVNQSVYVSAKTLYKLHIYIREIENLQVITYEWKYSNIVNSCKFSLSEFE